MSYAIIWIDDGGEKSSGRLDLSPTALVLTGTGARSIREVGYDDLTSARVERCAQLEQPPKPALMLELKDGERLVIGSLEGVGALYELADDLAAARAKARTPDESRGAIAAQMLAPRPALK